MAKTLISDMCKEWRQRLASHYVDLPIWTDEEILVHDGIRDKIREFQVDTAGPHVAYITITRALEIDYNISHFIQGNLDRVLWHKTQKRMSE